MSGFDLKQYKEALLHFLQLVDSLGVSKSLVAEHLRFPAHDDTTLASSNAGKDIWEEAAARALLEELLKDDDLSTWFGTKAGPAPESRLNELRGPISSMVSSWGESSATAEEIVRDWSTPLLEVLKKTEPACSRVRILYGVEVDERIEYASGIAIEPASVEGLRRFLQRTGGTERDALRLPRRPAVFVLTASQVSRTHFGPLAAITAYAWSDIMAENTRWDIWLATGILPRIGDAYVGELSQFPANPAERLPASQRETHADAADPASASINPDTLLAIAERMGPFRGEIASYPEQAITPLRVANTFIHPAVDTADPLMAVLLAYAGCEGLLLRRDDDDSRFGPRLAALIGADTSEKRRLRRVASRWAELRGYIAHGQHPPLEAVAAFLERELTETEASGVWWESRDLGQATKRRARELLRRVFLAVLNTNTIVEAGNVSPGLERDELLELLEQALGGQQSAQNDIDDRVPDFVRQASF